MAEYILSIDAGTTSNRIVLFDRGGQVVSIVAREFQQIYPQPGWVEHDAASIWRDVHDLMGQAYEPVRRAGDSVIAIGITNQRETVVLWDVDDGEPVHHAIVWQDRRGAALCQQLRDEGRADDIHSTTGLVVDSYFSASKIAWILDNNPVVRRRAAAGKVRFGTIDSWLLYKLTGGAVHATDYTNASRTMLYNIQTLQWDDELLTRLRIPSSLLPTVRPSSYRYGHTAAGVLPDEIPIGGMAGDQQAALFGQACFAVGMAKNTYGTGSFALLNIGDTFRTSTHRLLTTIAWGIDDTITYAFEGSIFITGAAIQWLRDGIGLIADAAESERLATSLSSNNGVYFVPAFVGLGAPHWDSYARGMIIGMTRGTGRAELARAALESIAYQSREVFDAMAADAGTAINEVRVDGGGAVNNFLMQFQADMLGTKVVRPAVIESTARGAAFLAGLAVGVWRSVADITAIWQEECHFTPAMDEVQRAALFGYWQQAVARAKHWVQ